MPVRRTLVARLPNDDVAAVASLPVHASAISCLALSIWPATWCSPSAATDQARAASCTAAGFALVTLSSFASFGPIAHTSFVVSWPAAPPCVPLFVPCSPSASPAGRAPRRPRSRPTATSTRAPTTQARRPASPPHAGVVAGRGVAARPVVRCGLALADAAAGDASEEAARAVAAHRERRQRLLRPLEQRVDVRPPRGVVRQHPLRGHDAEAVVLVPVEPVRRGGEVDQLLDQLVAGRVRVLRLHQRERPRDDRRGVRRTGAGPPERQPRPGTHPRSRRRPRARRPPGSRRRSSTGRGLNSQALPSGRPLDPDGTWMPGRELHREVLVGRTRRAGRADHHDAAGDGPFEHCRIERS